MDIFQKVTITTIKQKDNIIFETNYKQDQNSECLSFNMNSLKEMFSCIKLIKNTDNTIEYSEENDNFIITYAQYDAHTVLSKQEMLSVLYGLYYENIPAAQNACLKKDIMMIMYNDNIQKLKNNEKVFDAICFDNRVDIFRDGDLVSVAQGAIVDFACEDEPFIVIGAVGSVLKDHRYKIVIYQNDIKITINEAQARNIDSVSDINIINFLQDTLTYEVEQITEEECLKLNNNSLIFDINDYENDCEIKNAISNRTEFEDLCKYSIDNKKIITEALENNSKALDDDFFDDLF